MATQNQMLKDCLESTTDDARKAIAMRSSRIADLEMALRQINSLNDNPARFNKEIQDVLDTVIDTSDHKFLSRKGDERAARRTRRAVREANQLPH